MTEEQDRRLIELASGIVENYVANNQLQPDQVPEFLAHVHAKLHKLQHGEAGATGVQLPEPPVKPQNSVRKNDVVCLECGKTFKTLRRHLRTEHGLEEPEYKNRWGLPAGMKLVARSYSEQRAQMAKQIGLGAKGQSTRGGRSKK